jgi:hypothetical protein
MQSVSESKFQALRESIPATREQVMRRTSSLSMGTIRNVECSGAVRKSTATQLLRAINSLLKDAGMDVVTMADLGLTLRQDRRAGQVEPIEQVA